MNFCIYDAFREREAEQNEQRYTFQSTNNHIK